jgi:pyruvate/2-oxoacid:ferredoxin oxidoreductase beta subunit
MMVVVVNNFNYGMTGGQSAPTTPLNVQTTTYPSHPETPFDLCHLALGAGASYVARWTTFYVDEIIASMREALLHPGFAFIEILSQCPTYAARFFAEYQATSAPEERARLHRTPGAWMLKALKGTRVGEGYGHPKYELLLKDRKIELGVFVREQRPTVIEALQSLWTATKGVD